MDLLHSRGGMQEKLMAIIERRDFMVHIRILHTASLVGLLSMNGFIGLHDSNVVVRVLRLNRSTRVPKQMDSRNSKKQQDTKI